MTTPREQGKEPALLREMNPPSPWQPERDAVTLAVLGKLAEELAEAGAIVARCIIQGTFESEPVTGKRNNEALTDELADVQATTEIVTNYFALDRDAMEARMERKMAHLRKWHDLILGGDR